MGKVFDLADEFDRLQRISIEHRLLVENANALKIEFIQKMSSISNEMAMLQNECDAIRERMKANGRYKTLGNEGDNGGSGGLKMQDVCDTHD